MTLGPCAPQYTPKRERGKEGRGGLPRGVHVRDRTKRLEPFAPFSGHLGDKSHHCRSNSVVSLVGVSLTLSRSCADMRADLCTSTLGTMEEHVAASNASVAVATMAERVLGNYPFVVTIWR